MPKIFSNTYSATQTLSNSATDNPATVTSTGLIDVNSATIFTAGILGASGFAWTVTNLGTVESTGNEGLGIELLAGGAVTNGSTGWVFGSDAGIVISGGAGTVSNLGSVSAGYFDVYIKGGIGTVSNLGTLSASGVGGVGGVGVALENGGSVTNASTGSIAGYGDGAFIAGGIGTVSNLGTLSASGIGGDGVALESGGSVTNASTGSIAGNSDGIYITGGVGSVSNLGTVSTSGGVGGGGGVGVILENGGSVTNGSTGSIAAHLDGVLIDGGIGTVSNLGTVSAVGGPGLGGYGVILRNGGSVANGSTGSIASGGDGVYITGGIGAVSDLGIISGTNIGVDLDTGGSVTVNQYALISGTLGIWVAGAAGTVIDSGVISGSGGTAIQFGASDDSLILDPSAAIFGKVDGGTGSNTLELRAGAASGTLSALGAGFVNFGHVIVDPGANWTVVAASLAAGQVVAGSGGANRLVLQAAGTIDLSGVSGFPTIVLGDTGANSTSLHNTNFVGLSSPVITLTGGDFGNTINASALTGANRVIVTGGFRADQLTGGAGNDTLVGGAGNDWLNGGAGADTMTGGIGNDTYVVDNAGDVVSELAGQGTDTVRTNLTNYTLGANVENLTYIGGGNFTGNGNTLANLLTGGAGNDWLNGGTGADTMAGGIGNDTYVVDNAGDVVSELSGQGTDTVRTNLTNYTLGANVENLTYIGSGSFTGNGNSLNNVITGGIGNDTLAGGAGNDTLTGGSGHDSFRFDTALGATNVDHIVDFSTLDDTILLKHSVFAAASGTGALGTGTLVAGEFFIGAGAADSDDRIIYNSSTGALSYDPDGLGGAAATQFATLSTSLALTNTNFQIV